MNEKIKKKNMKKKRLNGSSVLIFKRKGQLLRNLNVGMSEFLLFYWNNSSFEAMWSWFTEMSVRLTNGFYWRD